jgi:ABC-type Fe3+-hydroxamate transport system substrate-binding protein
MNVPTLRYGHFSPRHTPMWLITLLLSLLIMLAGCSQPSPSSSSSSGSSSNDPFVAQAKAVVAAATAHVTTWDGPTSGPKAQSGKFIVYVSADQTNGGVSGVGKAVGDAAQVLGWRFKLLDGMGVSPPTAAFVRDSTRWRLSPNP